MEGVNFSQLEHVHSKYTGTGSADTTREEWLNTINGDAFASFIGHPNLVKYVSIAKGQCSARTKLDHLNVGTSGCTS